MSYRRIDSKLAAAIKAEYITGNTDIRMLAAKFNVRESTLKARIYRESWDEISDDEKVEILASLPVEEVKEKAPQFDLDIQKAVEGVEGLQKLDVTLQLQAQAILDLANTKLSVDSSVGELKSILDINIAIRNAYFNSKNPSVVVNNSTAISNTSLSFFEGVKRNEI